MKVNSLKMFFKYLTKNRLYTFVTSIRFRSIPHVCTFIDYLH